jgi:hypothetical protein
LAVLLAGARVAPAAVLCVRTGGGGGCRSSITAALGDAIPGDVIRVAAGDYTEFVTIAKTVTLEGGWDAGFTARDPAAQVTTIHPPDPSFSVVSIAGEFGNTAAVKPTLDGFTITGGGGVEHGGGLRIQDSDALVRNNVITNNVSYFLGGGVWVQRGAPTLERNRIDHNRADVDASGGGVQLENTQAVLIGNLIATNSMSNGAGSGGGVDVTGGAVTLIGNTIVDNTADDGQNPGSGGGIAFRGAQYTVINTIVARNRAVTAGGIIADVGSPGTLRNDTIVANSGDGVRTAAALTLVNSIVKGHAVGVRVIGAVSLDVSFNDFWLNTQHTVGFTPSGTNLDVDPLLDATYHLTAASPVADAGTSAGAPADDIDGEPRPMIGPSGQPKFDIGADELAATSTTTTMVPATTTTTSPDGSQCGNGRLDPGERCDDGDPLFTNDCCDARCQPRNIGRPCGDPSESDCDAPDTCDQNGNCVANRQLEGTPCRGSGTLGECDPGAVCDGENPECPTGDADAGCTIDQPHTVGNSGIAFACTALSETVTGGTSKCEGVGFEALDASAAASAHALDGSRVLAVAPEPGAGDQVTNARVKKLKAPRGATTRRATLKLKLNPLGRRLVRTQGSLRVVLRVTIKHGGQVRVLRSVLTMLRTRR